MAFSVRVSGRSSSDPGKSFSVEPSWWTMADVFGLEGVKYTQSNETGSYRDYDADLTRAQMKALYEKLRPGAFRGMWNLPDTHEFIRHEIETLDRAIIEDGDYDRFHVLVFEWDSGM